MTRFEVTSRQSQESASEEMALEMSSKGRERDKCAMICRIIQVESTA